LALGAWRFLGSVGEPSAGGRQTRCQTNSTRCVIPQGLYFVCHSLPPEEDPDLVQGLRPGEVALRSC
jgi:hypothetical protein